MKAKNWVIAILVIIVIVLIIWGMGSSAPAPAMQAPQGASSGQQAVDVTPATPSAPMGTYPIHINQGGPSIYYTPVNSATGTTGSSIEINNPPKNTIISSPLSVTGKAKGSWYFEASFQVILTDVNGKVLARTNAAALDNWQTADFVPFSGKLSFPAQPTGTKGVLILKKDNPSGMAANDASVEMQVTFK